MKQELIDHINFLARDIPPGAVNSVGLEDDVIFFYNQYINEFTEHEFCLEFACFIATKTRIENHIKNQTSKQSRLQAQFVVKPRKPSQQKLYHPKLPSIQDAELGELACRPRALQVFLASGEASSCLSKPVSPKHPLLRPGIKDLDCRFTISWCIIT